MNLTPWIACRYLLSRRSGRFAPFLTAIAVIGVAVGMMALVVIMSVMLGFRGELADRLLGFNAHITLVRGPLAPALSEEELRRILPEAAVRDIVPFVKGEVIAMSFSTGEPLSQGAQVRGIDPARLGAMERLELAFPSSSPGLDVLGQVGRELPGAIIGSEIVAQLVVHPDFEDTIDLIAPLASVGPTGEMEPNRRRLTVAGAFHSGLFDYDSKYILLSIPEAKRLLGEQASEGWQIRLHDAIDVPMALKLLTASLPTGWEASGWHQRNRKLFAALKLERIAMGGVMLMALLIASFSIAGVLLLMTQARRKDMAILASIGMSAKGLVRIFLTHAAIIGAGGSVLGLTVGLVLCDALRRWPLRLPDSYYLEVLPVKIDAPLVLLFAAVGVLVAVAASLYPIRQAARVHPIEVLRYE